jgi:hypothetical protein
MSLRLPIHFQLPDYLRDRKLIQYSPGSGVFPPREVSDSRTVLTFALPQPPMLR